MKTHKFKYFSNQATINSKTYYFSNLIFHHDLPNNLFKVLKYSVSSGKAYKCVKLHVFNEINIITRHVTNIRKIMEESQMWLIITLKSS